MIIQAFYLLLPAAFSNMAPRLFSRISFLNIPIDNNIKFKGKPLFGKNKTWRGVIFGVLTSITIAYIQFLLSSYSFFVSISVLNYSNFILIGFLLGLGTHVGDLFESFLKRRLNMKPGQSLLVLDQIDWVMGSLILLLFIYIPSFKLVVNALVLFFILHIIVKHIGYFLKIDNKKW